MPIATFRPECLGVYFWVHTSHTGSKTRVLWFGTVLLCLVLGSVQHLSHLSLASHLSEFPDFPHILNVVHTLSFFVQSTSRIRK